MAEFKVKVLTVGEVYRVFEGDTPSLDVVDALLFDECTLTDLTYMTTLTLEELKGMTFTEVERVIEEAKAVNPRFFAFREKFRALAQGAGSQS